MGFIRDIFETHSGNGRILSANESEHFGCAEMIPEYG